MKLVWKYTRHHCNFWAFSWGQLGRAGITWSGGVRGEVADPSQQAPSEASSLAPPPGKRQIFLYEDPQVIHYLSVITSVCFGYQEAKSDLIPVPEEFIFLIF